MSKKKILLIILLIIFGGYVGWQLFSSPIRTRTYHYKWLYNEMSEPEYIQTFKDFCKNELNDSIENLNYSQLVSWEHKYLTYTQNQFTRREMPINILKPYTTDGIAFGRCGEFALLFNGLCLANGYKTRLVFDESVLTNQSKSSAGDHVWVEVWTNNRWIHIDPTEQRFDEPKMYAVDWNKEINNVVAITKDNSGNVVTVDVTKDYQ